jgi:hypothetical protein
MEANGFVRCYGYAQGVMGGLLTVPAFLDRFPQVDIVNSSSFHNAWVTGMYNQRRYHVLYLDEHVLDHNTH